MRRVPALAALFGILLAAAVTATWPTDTRTDAAQREQVDAPHMPVRIGHRLARPATVEAVHARPDGVEGLPDELYSNDREVRAEAVATLADTASPADVDLLLEAWGGMDTRTRVLSLYVLGRTVERFDHPVRDALLANDGFDLLSATARAQAANASAAVLALGTLGTPAASDVLVDLSRDVQNPLGADALTTMARFPNPENIDALQRLALTSQDDALRLKAVDAMAAAHWMSEGTVGTDFLRNDGIRIAASIEQSSDVASLRYEARQIAESLAQL